MKVLTICGSLRTASFNRKLLKLATEVAQKLGAEVVDADLKKINLPMYDQDIEEAGMPANVLEFKKMVGDADVLIMASPEYNYSVTGALHNAIDWLSRGGNSLDKKTVAIIGTSPGPFGTVRGQNHLRQMLSALNAQFLAQPQMLLRSAMQAFAEDGSLVDQKGQEVLEQLIKNTFDFHNKLKV